MPLRSPLNNVLYLIERQCKLTSGPLISPSTPWTTHAHHHSHAATELAIAVNGRSSTKRPSRPTTSKIKYTHNSGPAKCGRHFLMLRTHTYAEDKLSS